MHSVTATAMLHRIIIARFQGELGEEEKEREREGASNQAHTVGLSPVSFYSSRAVGSTSAASVLCGCVH